MMLNRGNDVELDFDFNKVLEKNKDNPVFYVQYCYARINSLFRSLNLNLNKEIKIDKNNFELNDYDLRLMRKLLNGPKFLILHQKNLNPTELLFIFTI